jgi:hypothetical protein
LAIGFAVLLAKMVINTNPASSLTDQFSLSGFTPSTSAQVWQYGEAQDDAQAWRAARLNPIEAMPSE